MRKSLLDALFPRVRQRLLDALLLGPQDRWTLSELAHYLHLRPSSLQRELASLTDAEIVTVIEERTRRFYCANPICPLLPDLRGLLQKTGGLVQAVTEAVTSALPTVRFAFLFGSLARGERRVGSDVDLMLIGDLRLADIALELRRLERTLGIPVNAVVWTEQEFQDRACEGHHFLTNVLQSPKLFLKGSENELADLIGVRPNPSPYNEPSGDPRPARRHCTGSV